MFILIQDLSGYNWFIPSSQTNADTVADALLKWFRPFGTGTAWISGRDSHFKTGRIRLVEKSLRSARSSTWLAALGAAGPLRSFAPSCCEQLVLFSRSFDFLNGAGL